MRLIISIILLIICSCSNKPDFSAEKQEWYNEANERGCLVFPTKLYFADLKGEAVGYCVPRFGILIDIDSWNKFGPLQRKELVFHELGHCVLSLEHSELGLMAPNMHSEEELDMMWPKYLNLLFKGCLSLGDLIKDKQ